MKSISIGRHAVMLIDDEDEHLVAGFSLHINQGYVRTQRKREEHFYVHQLIAGPAAKGLCVDHINGNKLDNRRSNLRIVSQRENQVNRHCLNKNNRSGIRGVCFDKTRPKSPWKATIYINYETVNLGRFSSKSEALQARLSAEHSHGRVSPRVTH